MVYIYVGFQLNLYPRQNNRMPNVNNMLPCCISQITIFMCVIIYTDIVHFLSNNAMLQSAYLLCTNSCRCIRVYVCKCCWVISVVVVVMVEIFSVWPQTKCFHGSIVYATVSPAVKQQTSWGLILINKETFFTEIQEVRKTWVLCYL